MSPYGYVFLYLTGPYLVFAIYAMIFHEWGVKHLLVGLILVLIMSTVLVFIAILIVHSLRLFKNIYRSK